MSMVQGSPLPIISGVDLARSFNGSSDFIDMGNSAALNPATSISIACWVFPTNVSAKDEWAVARDDDVLGRSYSFGVAAAGEVLIQLSGASSASTTAILSNNQWYHLAATLIWNNATGGNIYVNGSVDPNTTNFSVPANNATTGDNTVGERTFSTSHGRWTGNITDIAIWNSILTPTQIANLAAGRRANTIGANANLAGYLPILGQSPEPDKSGNSNNGVLTGTAIVAGPPTLDLF
jgi:hypothetical protein